MSATSRFDLLARGLAVGLAIALQPMANRDCGASYPRPDLENVPISRLVRNLEKQVEDNPEDARLPFNLARVHAMAYAWKTDTAQVNRRSKHLRAWFGYDTKHVPFEPVKETTDQERLQIATQHLAKAIQRYQEAVKLDPDNLTAQLGLAWCIEQVGDKEQAIEAYREVAAVGWKRESQRESGWGDGHFVSIEAGEYLKRLLDPRKGRSEIRLLEARARYLMELPRSVTPIIVPLVENVQLDELLDRQASVAFDADGTGLRRTWSWITPQAGWLVYDHRNTGKITSALQMFGGVTFMLFWDNGYEALASLDDNADGELAGEELLHLAIWQDVNGDGRCDAGEVKALGDWEIKAINCQGVLPHDNADVAAYAPLGIRFSDGRERPTYDVILRRPGHAAPRRNLSEASAR